MGISEDLRTFFQTYLNFRSTLFWLHQRRELRRFKGFFDTVEKQPLTSLQRRSVILDERRNLIVAGAGTGKTSVIVAKAGYLIQSGVSFSLIVVPNASARAREYSSNRKQVFHLPRLKDAALRMTSGILSPWNSKPGFNSAAVKNAFDSLRRRI